MRKRFIVLLDSATKTQNDAFYAFIQSSQNLGWWHWFNNTWLLTTFDNSYSCTKIREKVNEIYPGIHCLVLELQPNGSDFWSGFGPNVGEKDMFKWIHENWKTN